MKRFVSVCLALLTVLSLAAAAPRTGGAVADGDLTILFTHDTHDHFLPMPKEGGGEYGGYTRLATRLEEERAKAETPVVTLDAGDFSMGSLFQTVYATDAPELRAMGAMGFDVTTLGNHEFDYRRTGLAAMLNAAVESGGPLPQLVQANYKPPVSDKDTWAAWDRYGVKEYTVIERDGLRVAVFGVLGVDADECAPMSGMEFEPVADAARRVVAQIEAQESPDYIICVSHSGTDPDPKRSEDEQLAKAVPGIDVIISGHTHSTTPEPIRVNDTLIVSCGEYTQNLGVLTIGREGEGVAVRDYRLVPIDETVLEDAAMISMANAFKEAVDRGYLADYGLSYDQVLAESPFDFTPITRFGAVQEEDALGNLIADSYIHAVKEAEGADYVPVDFAVVASGVIRASFAKGEITVSDAFNVSSLGSGGDGSPGYPLISVWITGRELRDAFEIDASVTPIMPAAQLYGAGMTWSFNPRRIPFDRVTACAQVLEDGTRVPIENDRLYRVVTGLYSGQMLGAVNGKSFGILTITPKDADGAPVEDYERQIIRNPNGSEVKEWYALASYLKSMGTVDERYRGGQGRKVVSPSWSPIELFKNPNWITLTVLGLILLFTTAVVFFVYRIATGRRRAARRYRGRRTR